MLDTTLLIGVLVVIVVVPAERGPVDPRSGARGLGRQTFRSGGFVHQAFTAARHAGLGDYLDDVRDGYLAERREVMAEGWLGWAPVGGGR